jgi:hypothetical protein
MQHYTTPAQHLCLAANTVSPGATAAVGNGGNRAIDVNGISTFSPSTQRTNFVPAFSLRFGLAQINEPIIHADKHRSSNDIAGGYLFNGLKRQGRGVSSDRQ